MKKLKIILIILLFVIYAYLTYYPYILEQEYGFLQNQINNIRIIVLLLALTLLYSYTKTIIHEKKGYKRGVKFYLTSILRLVYYASVLSALFVYLGGSLEGLSTIIGLVGAGLAISLQKPILNFAGFLSILINKIYSKGDVIEIDGVKGIVYDINTIHTKLYEFDQNGIERDVVVTLPNSLVLDKKVKNYSRPADKAAFSFTISITYDSNLDKALKKVRKIIDESWILFYRKNKSKVDKAGYSKLIEKPSYRVSTMFSSSSIDITVTYKVPLIFSASLRTYLVNSIFNKLPENDIEFAYPHMEVLIKKKRR